MKQKPSIITIGLSPAWDITCLAENPQWGRHINIHEQTIFPAGKALNVSKALALMGQRSIAAGLWGQSDYQRMKRVVKSLWPLIKVKMTTVAGGTRENVTIVDVGKNRDMHLRSPNRLASPGALQELKSNLQSLVNRNSICVFAGAMPEGKLLADVIRIVKNCSKAGAQIVLDTSGPALRKIVDTGHIRLIKPNVRELGELSGKQIEDKTITLAREGRKLLGKVEIVLISRGKKGAIAVTEKGTWYGKFVDSGKVSTTVGCGDYLLAGFIKGLTDKNNPVFALETAIKSATAKALGLPEDKNQPKMTGKIRIKIGPVN